MEMPQTGGIYRRNRRHLLQTQEEAPVGDVGKQELDIQHTPRQIPSQNPHKLVMQSPIPVMVKPQVTNLKTMTGAEVQTPSTVRLKTHPYTTSHVQTPKMGIQAPQPLRIMAPKSQIIQLPDRVARPSYPMTEPVNTSIKILMVINGVQPDTNTPLRLQANAP